MGETAIENSGMVWQELHEMEMTIDEEGGMVCHCQDCGRKLRFFEGNMQVIQQGNIWATHMGSSGGLVMDAVVV